VKALIDNDILYKGACYGILSRICGSLNCAEKDIGALGAARFVVRKKIKRAMLSGGAEIVLKRLAVFLAGAHTLEPRPQEQSLAADLEAAAQFNGLGLHEGESQLCAILIMRGVSTLLTGDKVAIAAIEQLLSAEPRMLPISGKVKCLEQLVVSIIDGGDPASLRPNICAEPTVDVALSICFSCSSPHAMPASIMDGLDSYIRELRATARRTLAP